MPQPAPEGDVTERQLIELLNELRVALPGVQVLFAFLLTVPFNQRFDRATETQERLYLLALVASAASTLFLVAPTAYHRLRFHRGVRPAIIRVTNRCLLAGLAMLGVAIAAVLALVVDFVFGAPEAVAVTTAAVAAATWLWLGKGLADNAREHTPEQPDPARE